MNEPTEGGAVTVMWDDYHHPMHDSVNWANGLVLLAVLVLFLAALAVLAFALFRGTATTTRPDAGHPDSYLTAAERVLAERFARGELDEEEYRHRRAVLRSP